MSHFRAVFITGLIALTVNTIVLKGAAPLGILAESGGLLRLHVIYLGPLVERSGLAQAWASAGLPGPTTTPFWLAFHYTTGFVMVLLYAYLIEPILPGNGLTKGTLFSLLPWLINGLIVLPLLGQGPLGVRRLPASGIAYFFLANWSFGAVLGVLYHRYREARRIPYRPQ